MNEYEIIVRQRLAEIEAERKWNENGQFVEELTRDPAAHPKRLHLTLHFPRLRLSRLPHLARSLTIRRRTVCCDM